MRIDVLDIEGGLQWETIEVERLLNQIVTYF